MKEGTRISKDGALAASEFLRLFVVGGDHFISAMCFRSNSPCESAIG